MKKIFNEVTININMTQNPMPIVLPENSGNESRKSIAILEVVGESICQSLPAIFYINGDFNTSFDATGKRNSMLAFVKKEQVLGNITQYYRNDRGDETFFPIGSNGTVHLIITDINDNILAISKWLTCIITLKLRYF
jgi:hypothetical protein